MMDSRQVDKRLIDSYIDKILVDKYLGFINTTEVINITTSHTITVIRHYHKNYDLFLTCIKTTLALILNTTCES